MQASEEHYRAIVEDQTEFIVRWLPDGTRTFVNEAYCRYFGRGRDDVIGESFMPLVSVEDRDAVRRKIDSLTVENPAITDEHRVIRPDGSVGWQQWTDRGIFDDDGRLVELQSVGRDITARKIAEAALRDREARLRLMIKQMPAVLWTVDTDLRFTSSQGLGLKELNLEPDENVGVSLYEYFRTDDPGYPPIAAHRRALDGMSIAYETNWAERVFQSHVEPLRDADGDIIGCIGASLDVTEHKAAEAEASARAEAERLLLRELDHRVRNNLASLAALIDLTARSAKDVQQFRIAIRARVQAMATVHVLLSRSHWQPVNLETLMGALIPPGCRGTIRLGGVDIGMVASQAQAMGMVLNELMANSLKYGALGSPRGVVDVRWDLAPGEAGRSQLTLTWNESGGPPITAEPKPGVGAGLINGLVAYELHGRVSLTYPTAGAQHRFELSLDDPASVQ